MGTWVRDGTTVNLEDDTDTVSIGAGATPPGVKLEVVGGPARLVLEDKGGEVHNVRAYGAVGDGITDDTGATPTSRPTWSTTRWSPSPSPTEQGLHNGNGVRKGGPARVAAGRARSD